MSVSDSAMPVESAVEQALQVEIEALSAFYGRDRTELLRAAQALSRCKRDIVLCGMGKCGHVAKKIVATLLSTGTPAKFLHPTEAVHGDLGIIQPGDNAVFLSYSGETAETVGVAQYCVHLGMPMAAMTGNAGSTLASLCGYVIDVRVAREADPLDIAPTASTTVMMAAGDALAAGLMAAQQFSRERYAEYHPGGSLGHKLLTTLEHLMVTGERLPVVAPENTVREAIVELSGKRLGAVFVADGAGILQGIFTDGDLRRLMQDDGPLPLQRSIAAAMTQRPRMGKRDMLASDALLMMEENAITVLPVVDVAADGPRLVGGVHLHELVRLGLLASK